MASPSQSTPQDYSASAESAIVKHDTIQTILVNVLFIGILIALYYWNRSSHALDAWVGSLFNF